MIHIRFLGTGTSQGIPVIGCTCEVCTSSDPRDQRLRCAVLVRKGTDSLVVDIGPDFRRQMLNAGLKELQGILLTHEHNDHIIGLDEVRPFNFRQWSDMPVYGLPRVLDEVRKRFAYIFDPVERYPGAPMVVLNPVDGDHSFRIAGMEVLPIRVMHGQLPILGYRFGDFTYITDAKSIPEGEMEKLRGTRLLVLNALHHRVHHSHLNLKQALELVEEIGPERAYLTHLSHHMGLHQEEEPKLPPHVHFAYDGLELSV